jgi:hypothetical protein
VRGGTGLAKFRRRKAGGWTGSDWVARGEGGEAVGTGDSGGVKRSRRIPARNTAASSVSRGGRRGKQAGERGFGSGFIGGHDLVEERERGWQSRAEPRTAGGAGVLCGAWQPLGIGDPTWQGEGRTAEAARAVGGVVGRRVEGWRTATGAREPTAGGGSCARAEAGEIGDSRKMMEDLGAKSKKARDPTVMHK